MNAAHPLSDGILHSHWADIDSAQWRWVNFSAQELSSKGNGECYLHVRTMDAVQRARDGIGLPLYVNSAHRDWLHNIAVGGAPLSAHLYIALDISTHNHKRGRLYRALRASGFQSFGFYRTFIHADLRPGRMWFGDEVARDIWTPVLGL